MSSFGDFLVSFALVHPALLPQPPLADVSQQPPMAEPTENTNNQVISAFHNHPRFICANCSAVLALQDELISKSFSGREGRGLCVPHAYRHQCEAREKRGSATSVIRTCSTHEPEVLIDMPRTGVHTVADVFCLGCNDRVGWYYHKASDHTQKYKEGKYLLEREKMVKENNWELDE